MKVRQLVNNNCNPAANQFVLNDGETEYFQSYDTIIAKYKDGKITLDNNALNYSRTTSKHLFIYLGMNRKEIEAEIKTGLIKLENLNS